MISRKYAYASSKYDTSNLDVVRHFAHMLEQLSLDMWCCSLADERSVVFPNS